MRCSGARVASNSSSGTSSAGGTSMPRPASASRVLRSASTMWYTRPKISTEWPTLRSATVSRSPIRPAAPGLGTAVRFRKLPCGRPLFRTSGSTMASVSSSR